MISLVSILYTLFTRLAYKYIFVKVTNINITNNVLELNIIFNLFID